MTDSLRNRADARLGTALADADWQDPRDHYRPALSYLKRQDEAAFQRALRYFQETLVPAVAGETEPLTAWTEYGLVLARSLGPGRLLELDSTGRARPLEEESVPEARGLVLHVPDAAAAPALVIRCPRRPSAAQQATIELLVEGRQTASRYA